MQAARPHTRQSSRPWGGGALTYSIGNIWEMRTWKTSKPRALMGYSSGKTLFVNKSIFICLLVINRIWRTFVFPSLFWLKVKKNFRNSKHMDYWAKSGLLRIIKRCQVSIWWAKKKLTSKSNTPSFFFQCQILLIRFSVEIKVEKWIGVFSFTITCFVWSIGSWSLRF